MVRMIPWKVPLKKRLKILVPLVFITLIWNLGMYASPIRFNPMKKEGYFQGWNYYFQSSSRDTTIFVTFLVSNLGPGSLNHGTSVFINSAKTGIIYKTNEYSSRELHATPGRFGQRSRDSYMEKIGNRYHILIQTEEMDLELEFFPTHNSPIPLSDGERKLEEWNGFLRADIGFPRSQARVRFNHNGKDLVFLGEGGMEHLNTDTEVYKYSSQWEILRSYNKKGEAIFYGGYKPKKISSQGTHGAGFYGFQRVIYSGSNGRTIWSDEVEKIEILEYTVNHLSGYKIPTRQLIHLKNLRDCEIAITNTKLIGEINILSNISAVLKFLIQLFFAKPYQIHYDTEVNLKCEGKPSLSFSGIHSYYLINPMD